MYAMYSFFPIISYMLIQKKHVENFIENYKTEFCVDLSFEEATKLASQIIEFYEIVFGNPLFNYKDNNNQKNGK